MKASQIKAGLSYVAAVGRRVYEVERIDRGSVTWVFYTVVSEDDMNGKRGSADLYAFAKRVKDVLPAE